MADSSAKRRVRGPLYLAAGLLIVFAAIFVVAFISTSQGGRDTGAAVDLAPDTYMDRVGELLAGADPENGDVLLDRLECFSCHRTFNTIAPRFVGIAEQAATRRPPLTAAAYIYESIVFPRAYLLDGYEPIMPEHYPEKLTDREIGDILSYLLTSDAR